MLTIFFLAFQLRFHSLTGHKKFLATMLHISCCYANFQECNTGCGDMDGPNCDNSYISQKNHLTYVPSKETHVTAPCPTVGCDATHPTALAAPDAPSHAAAAPTLPPPRQIFSRAGVAVPVINRQPRAPSSPLSSAPIKKIKRRNISSISSHPSHQTTGARRPERKRHVRR
jgi:hypothetical protein